eukprot:328194-Amphidinium_carterae.1
MKGGTISNGKLEKVMPLCWNTDAKSLHDVLCREGTSVTDKRLRILVAQLREMRREYAIHFSWLDTALMLSDCLTKLECSKEYFRKCFSDCYWDSRCTDETRATKALCLRKQRLRSCQGAGLAVARDAVEADAGDKALPGPAEAETCSGSRRLPDAERVLQSARSLPLPDADCSNRLTQPLGSRPVLKHHSLDGQACVCVSVTRFAWTLMEGQWQDRHQRGAGCGRKTRGAARV